MAIYFPKQFLKTSHKIVVSVIQRRHDFHCFPFLQNSFPVFPRLRLDPTWTEKPDPHCGESDKAEKDEFRVAYEKSKQFALEGGGAKGREKHVKANKKMLPRDRIIALLDAGSEALELSLQAGLGMEYGDIPNATVTTVIGAIHDQLCMLFVNDATVKGGTIFPITLKKQLRAQQIAQENSLPCIYVIDSGGAFLPLQAEIFNPGGRTFYNQAIMSAKGIPQLAMVCGSCTAGGAYIPTMADESVIVKSIGHVFLAGPPLVKAALGEDVSTEDLGGADLHCRISGCTDHYAETEEEGFAMLRASVASLNLAARPAPRRHPLPPIVPPSSLVRLPSRPNFDLVLAATIDDGAFNEFKAKYGDHLKTKVGFAHLEGHQVGILGISGPLTKQDAIKSCHFIQLCSQRDVPIIVFQNCSENSSSSSSSPSSSFEITSTLRAHAQMMTAFACSGSPVVTIATGPNNDVSAFAAAPPASGARFSFAWPQAAPPIPGLANPETSYNLALAAHPDIPDEKKAKLRRRLESEVTSIHAASRCWNDGVFLPEDTRTVLGQCLRIFEQSKVNQQQFATREKMTLANLKF